MWKRMASKFLFNQLGFELNVLIFSQLILWISYYLANPFFSIFFIQKNLDPEYIGLILGCRTLFYSIGMVIGGGISDQFNAKKITVFSLTALSLLNTVLLFDLRSMLYVYIFSAIGLLGGISFSGESKLIVDSSNKDNRLLVFSLMRTVISLSSILYPIVLYKFFIDNHALFFLSTAVVYSVYALTLWLALPGQKFLGANKVNFGNVFHSIYSYCTVFKNKNFMFVFLVVSLSVTACSFIDTTLPMYLKYNTSESLTYYSLIINLNAYCAIAFQIFAFPFLKKVSSRTFFLCGNMLFVIGFITVLTNEAFLLGGVIFIIIGRVLALPSALVMLVDHAVSPHYSKYLTVANLRIPIAQSISSFFGFLIMSKLGMMHMICFYILISCAAVFMSIPIFSSKTPSLPLSSGSKSGP